jgi:hypothetical protein
MENLQRMVEGGAKEGDQATHLLVSQIHEYLRAKSEGRDPEWQIDAGFLPAIQRAWEDTDADEVEHRYVLAFFQRQFGDPEGLEHLIELLALGDSADPDGRIRFLSTYAVGVLAPAYDAAERRIAGRKLAEVVRGQDSGLQIVAIGGLAGIAELAGEEDPTAAREAVEALRGALGASKLDVRGSAALALAGLDDAAGAAVLGELIGPEAYEAEHREHADRWYRADQVSGIRIQAVRALARLGRPEDLAVLAAAEAGEDDQNVRAALKAALDDARGE